MTSLLSAVAVSYHVIVIITIVWFSMWRRVDVRMNVFMLDLSDSDEIVKLLTQAGGERQASKLPEVYSPAGGTFLLPAPLSPVAVSILPDSPSPSNDSGVDTNDAPLTPTQIQSVNINFDEFELARTASKIL